MILLKKINIGDNKEWFKAAKINISFKFEVDGTEHEKSLGTFTDVKDHSDLSISNIVVLPPTKIENYITITVNAMEIDQAESLLSKIPIILEGAKEITGKLPIPENLTNAPFDIIGHAVNIAAALNEDDVIMRKQISFFVEKKYPELPPDRYFYTGNYDFVSEEEKKEENCSHVILKFVKASQ